MTESTATISAAFVLMSAALAIILGGLYSSKPRAWALFSFIAVALAAGMLLVNPSVVPLVFLSWGALTVLMSSSGRINNSFPPNTFGAFLLALACLLISLITDSLLTLFLTLQLFSLSMGLFYLSGNNIREVLPVAVKLLLMKFLCLALIGFGFSIVFCLAGTGQLSEIAKIFRFKFLDVESAQPPLLGIIALVLITVGIGSQMLLLPFSFSGLFDRLSIWRLTTASLLSLVFGFTVYAKLLSTVFVGVEQAGLIVIGILAAATMLVGSVQATRSEKIKNLLASTALAHGGFLLFSFSVGFWSQSHEAASLTAGSGFLEGNSTGLFYLIVTLFAYSGVCALLIFLSSEDQDIEFIDQLSGAVSDQPLAALSISVLLLSLIGVPPLAGFWGKAFLFLASLSAVADFHEPHWWILLVNCLAGLSLLLLAVAYFRVISTMLFKRSIARLRLPERPAALSVGLLATFFVLGVGLMPGPVVQSLRKSAFRHRPAVTQLKNRSKPVTQTDNKTISKPLLRN